ncbi:MAG: EamA family transporter [Solirubrobacteraceae bacterium]
MAVRDGAQAQAVARGWLRPGGVPLVLLAIGSLQFGAALAGTIFDRAGPAGTALLRAAFAALFLALIVRPRVRVHEPRHLRLAVLFGLLLGLMNLCIYESFARIGLGIAVTIEFAGPLTVAVALSRKRSDLACAAMAALGIVLLADPGGGRADVAGVLLALAAAACWAAYILVAQAAGRVFRGAEGVALAMWAAVLVPLVPGIAGGGSALLSPEVLAVGAAVALLSSVLPYTLETEALRRVPAHVFGVLMSLEPAVAALAGFLVLGERLSVRDLVAIALVIAASVVVTRSAPPAAEA